MNSYENSREVMGDSKQRLRQVPNDGHTIWLMQTDGENRSFRDYENIMTCFSGKYKFLSSFRYFVNNQLNLMNLLLTHFQRSQKVMKTIARRKIWAETTMSLMTFGDGLNHFQGLRPSYLTKRYPVTSE